MHVFNFLHVIYEGAMDHMKLVETYEMGLTLSSCFSPGWPYRFKGHAEHRQLKKTVEEVKSKSAREHNQDRTLY